MTAAEAIYSLLSNDPDVADIVDDRIYPLTAPQTRVAPFVTFQQIVNDPSNTKTGPSVTDILTFQVNCIAKDFDTCDALRSAVRNALDYMGVDGVPQISFQGEIVVWDDNSQLEGAIAYAQDYRVFVSNGSVVTNYATAILINTNNTVISETQIAPRDSATITAPDATAVIKNSQGTTIDTEDIPSNVREDVVLPDEDYEVYVNGGLVDSGSFPVYGNVTIDINL